MTRTVFLEALAWDLRLRGVPYIRPDLEAFVDDVWTLAEADLDLIRWADAFAQAPAETTAAVVRSGPLVNRPGRRRGHPTPGRGMVSGEIPERNEHIP